MTALANCFSPHFLDRMNRIKARKGRQAVVAKPALHSAVADAAIMLISYVAFSTVPESRGV